MRPDGHPTEPPVKASEARDEGHALAAEQVTTALVGLRGGAPFLSSADVTVLVGWLDDGVTVARILRGLDAAATRRREQRRRAPLALRDARRWLGTPKGTWKPSTKPPPVIPTGGHTLNPMVCDLRAAALDPALRGLAATLATDLLALPEDDLTALADASADRIVTFFANAWIALGEAGRARYTARAAALLDDLLDDLDDATREMLLEEHARGLLRGDLPCLSLTALLLLVEG